MRVEKIRQFSDLRFLQHRRRLGGGAAAGAGVEHILDGDQAAQPDERARRQNRQQEAAIVINQLIVPTQSDEFWRLRAERQQQLLQDIENSFSKYPLYPIYLQQTDVRGTEALSMLLRPPS